jgi:hypothetical protein
MGLSRPVTGLLYIRLSVGSNDFSRVIYKTSGANYNCILSPMSLTAIFILTSNSELYIRQSNSVEYILL